MSVYDQLCDLTREVALIQSSGAALSWDQETSMPPRSLDYRARQLAYLDGRSHALFTGRKYRLALEKAEKERLKRGSKEAANVSVLRENLERAIRIPTKLVEEESALTAHSKAAWAEARAKSDFASFAPHLVKLLDLARRKADLWGYEDEPYDALLRGYERGARTREIAALFTKLKPELADIARAAVERSRRVPANLLRGKYPVAKQQQLNREVAESIGFDFEGGRVDTTAHPFCTTLGAGDVRLTTRYDEADFTSSLFGVMHEAGHGMYEQGLPPQDYGLPSGAAVSLGIHESQSRLWENHVGRSRAFWAKWLPRAAELFPNLRKLSLDQFLSEVNRAAFSYIRVEADEATYDLHILLRFDLERRMVRGDLKVADVPAAWNESFRELFGLTPPDDRRGCLQDIHWSMGGLGYFATYTLGNLNAAQLFATANKQKRIADAAAKADYAPMLEWLRKKVHAPGSTLRPQELMRHATGHETQAKWHLAHLRKRFL
jgi:carboxypeptidase Taq